MQRLLLSLACLASAPALACPSIATTSPRPPADEDLYPARLVRVDSRPVNTSTTTEMFQGLRLNDGQGGARQIFSAPQPVEQPRSQLRLSGGVQVVEVIEAIPDAALPREALRDRRWMNNPRPKAVTIDVEPGQRYAVAARLVQPDPEGVRSNAYWEPVVWRQEAIACRGG